MSEQTQPPLFEEEQRFRQLWLWTTILAVSLLLLVLLAYGLYQQLYLGRPFGNKPMSDSGLTVFSVVMSLFSISLPLLLYTIKLSVRLDSRNLSMRFFPFSRKSIPLDDIVHWEARTYHPIREYGGWGIRYSWRGKGMAYNVSGNRGVQLELRDGKRLLIGSQCTEEFARAIDQVKKEQR